MKTSELRLTDWDDLRRYEGLNAVKQQILNPVKVSSEPTALRALEARNAKGEATKPAESIVAKTLLEFYGNALLVQDQDVFLYQDGYWQHQGKDGIKTIKRELGILYGTKAGSRDIANAYTYFLIHAPTPPPGINLFVPQYWSANFRNGTLHFIKQPGGKPRLDFRPHDRTEFITTQLPFDFPGLDRLGAPPALFEEMLKRIWKNDVDYSAKRRSLAQLFGASIMPAYTKVFFLVGKRGSGKSTVIKLINRLVDGANVSRVDPSYFHGFHMETMVGKLVNMDPDINLHKPIQDDIIKKIIDRVPFRVSRKFQTDLIAPLPPIHIFGGNDLPMSMEGATGAYERRVIILRFGSYSAETDASNGTGYKLDFDEWLWEQASAEIIAFAVQGLIDLISLEGHFIVPDSSREAIKDWDSRSDILGQFLDAMDHKELDQGNQYFRASEALISRKDLWACFSKWQSNALSLRAPWNQKQFVNAMRSKDFDEKKIQGVRHWCGIGTSASAQSDV